MDYLSAYGFSQFGIEDPNFILPSNIVNPIYNDTDFVSSYLESSTNYEPSLNHQSLEGETLVIKTTYEKLCSSNQVINTNTSTSKYTNFIAFGGPSSTPLEEHQYAGGLVFEEAMPQQIFDFSSNAPLKLLGELEKLHLTIINCSVIPFDASHDITIIAQRTDGCGIPKKELMEKVISAILRLV